MMSTNTIFCAAALAMMIGSQLGAATLPVPPDLTQSNKVDRKLTYNLGATGLRGWICTKPASFLDSVQGRTTTASRQILITHVGANSPADVLFAETQGGHGSESRTGVIMKETVSCGSAAREALPGLRELLVQLNEQCRKGEFPAGELNNRRVTAVEEAIKAIEAATGQPELRSIHSAQPKGSPKR